MAIEPATYDMTVQRRSDHSIQLVFKDSSDDAINLTGFTVAAQVWEETRTTKYADFAVTYTSRTAGTVDIALTDTQTDNFNVGTLKYDVKLTEPSGDEHYYIKGNLNVTEGYTE